MEKGLAIITGADGGMGQVITAALAKEGYPVIMACLDPEKAVPVCTRIRQETGNTQIEVRRIDLASLSSVNNFTGQLLKEGRPVSRLMNNAGILTTPVRKTEDGLETIVSVNYVAPYMLTRQLLPLMQPGCRIVNTVSSTLRLGAGSNRTSLKKEGTDAFSAFRSIAIPNWRCYCSPKSLPNGCKTKTSP